MLYNESRSHWELRRDVRTYWLDENGLVNDSTEELRDCVQPVEVNLERLQTLAVEIDAGGVTGVFLNSKRLPVFSNQEANGLTRLEDYQGDVGLINEQLGVSVHSLTLLNGSG